MQKSVVFALVLGLGCLMLASCRSRGGCCPRDCSAQGDPDVVVIDDTTPEVEPEDSLVGIYTLDVEAMVADLGAEAPPGMAEMLGQMNMTIEIKADGTWTGLMKRGADEQNAGGTWERKGDSTLVMHETMAEGTPDKPDTQEFQLEDGAIVMAPAGAPFKMRLVKQ